MISTKRDLLDALPRYYNDSPEVEDIMYSNSIEIDKLRGRSRELLKQYYPSTATYGLDDWERVLDLPPMPNSSIRFRRSRILARLNGVSPATVAHLSSVVNSHIPNRDARIVEYNSEYTFDIEVPIRNTLDLSSIRRDIDEIKPAHLGYEVSGVIHDVVDISLSDYEFGVPFPICNEFSTGYTIGRGIFNDLYIEDISYNFDVGYPICGEFMSEGVI